MPLALILSSFVAGSRVGGFPQALALASFKIDPVLVPTVLFGRRPGPGVAPGGGAVAAEVFSGVLDGVASYGLLGMTDVVITGYFASPQQVERAAEVIDQVRAAPRTGAFGAAFSERPFVVVDPIMGDEPDGLYVSEAVAKAIAALLVPCADYLTPNVWELGRLTGAAVSTAGDVVRAARALDRPTLVTSVPLDGDRIGAVYADAEIARLFSHRFVADAPHGTGDVVAAILAAQLIEGAAPALAAERAIQAAAEAVFAAEAWNSLGELPVVALGDRLRNPTAEVRVEPLA